MPQVDVSTFTGREEQLQQLEALLLNCQGSKVCSIVGLSGGGGIGKSALASYFATKHQDKFPDGVIGLRVDGKDIDTIAREFVRTCRVPLDSEDERDASTLMQEVFAHRQMLLIFDNAVDATIKKLRPGGSRCAVIITTRNRTLPSLLDISDEGSIDLDPLPLEDCRELLNKILGNGRVNVELEATDEIIDLVGNLPLALQIVGKTLKRERYRSLADYTISLQQEKTRLKRLRIRDDSDLNVEASLNLSLKHLNKIEQDFFACLSICAAKGFSRRTAMATGGFEDEWEANDYLLRLYELSILNENKEGDNRFVFHPLVRVYAENLAQERDLLSVAKERHAKFFVEWLQSDDMEKTDVVADVAANLDDAILAAEWLQIHDADAAESKMKSYKFILKLQPLFEQYGYWKQAIDLMTKSQSWAEQFQDWNAVVKYKVHQARYCSFTEEFDLAEKILHVAKTHLQKIEDIDTRNKRESKLLNVLAGIFQKQDKIEEAIQIFRDEILIEEEIGDERSLGIVCNRLGKLLQFQGEGQEAQMYFERGITINKSIGELFSVAIGLNCLGGLFHQEGKLKEAQLVFEQEIEIDKVLNDQFKLAITLNRLGGLFQQQGELNEAEKAFKQQIAISEALNAQTQLSIGWNCLGRLFQQQGNLDEAVKAFEGQIAIAKTLDDQTQLAIGLSCLGGLFQQQGNLDEAQKAFRRQIAISEALNDKTRLAITWSRLGGLLQQQGNLDEAQKAFEREIEIAEALKDQTRLAIALKRLGRLLQQQGNLDEAQKDFKRAIKIAEALNDQTQLAIGLSCLGGLLQQQGNLDEAQKAFEREIEIDEALKDQTRLALALKRLGGLRQQQGNLDEAQKAFERAIESYEALNDQPQLIIELNSLGVSFQAQGKLDKAQKAFERQIEIYKFLNDRSSRYGWALHNLGRIWKSKGDFEQAEMSLRESQEIFEDEKDFIGLAKVMNTLGSVLEKQQKWDKAEKILRQSYDLAVRLDDTRGQAIITNSLAQVITNQEGEEKFELAQMYFLHSIKLGEKLNNRQHLAKVYTSMGQSLLAHKIFDRAVEALSKGFEIDESLSNIRGLRIVTPELTFALCRLGRRKETFEYYERALIISPNDPMFIQLRDKRKKQLVLPAVKTAFPVIDGDMI